MPLTDGLLTPRLFSSFCSIAGAMAEEGEIQDAKEQLAAVKAMKLELGAAVAASDFAQVQILAKRLKVTELKQQLSAAVAANNFDDVARLGKELDEYSRPGAQVPLEPAPEPEQVGEQVVGDLGAAAVWGSTPNDTAKAAYRAWEDELMAAAIAKRVGEDEEDDGEGMDPDEMAELQFLDEPTLLAPTVTLVDAADGVSPGGALVRWQLIGPHRHDPAQRAEMTTDRFRVSFKHSSWWTWQYVDIVLNESPDCMRIAESEGGSCEFLLKAEPGGLEQPGQYSVAMAALYEFVGEWSLREWSETTTFAYPSGEEGGGVPATGNSDGTSTGDDAAWCAVQ